MIDHILEGHLRMARSSMSKALLRVKRGKRFRNLAESDMLDHLDRVWRPIDGILSTLIETDFPGTCVACQSCGNTKANGAIFNIDGLCQFCVPGKRMRSCRKCGVTSTDVKFRTFDTESAWLCSKCPPP